MYPVAVTVNCKSDLLDFLSLVSDLEDSYCMFRLYCSSLSNLYYLFRLYREGSPNPFPFRFLSNDDNSVYVVLAPKF